MGGFDTAIFFGALLAFVIGTTFAKACQALVAYRFGDRLPASEGRLSFRPGRQLDPLGLLLALFLALGIDVVAWGKPLNLNPGTNRLRRLGGTFVALTGPLAYLLLALISGLLFNLLIGISPNNPSVFIRVAYWFTYYNVLLAAFNLVPIPPLDGYNIIKGLLPPHWDLKLSWLETYGSVILLVLALLLPFFIRINLIYIFCTPFVRLFMSLLGLPSPL